MPMICQGLFPGPFHLRVKDYLCDCICKNDKALMANA